MRQQLADPACSLRRQPRQHIFQVGVRIMSVRSGRLDQAHDRRRAFAAA